MTKEQATVIIVLLAAVLFVVLVGRAAALELLYYLFWAAIGVWILVVVASLIRDAHSNLISNSREKKRKKLECEIEQLCREISTYPGPQLTNSGIPQGFPSKEAAQAFGQRWSRGGPGSFSAKALDAN
jgi:amino acid transporter